MKGLTFASFTIDESNQAAVDACRRVASLRADPGKPVTLLGERGTGKSHLLWSIVNQFREKQTRVSVALISANDFPRKVRNLVEDPSPIMRSRPAVLLVDELERFKDNLAELEGVVHAFLDNGHVAVLASRIHPAALSGFSGKFKTLLTSNSIIGMQGLGTAPSDSGIPRLALDRIAGLKQTVTDLEQERDRLKEKLDVTVEHTGEQAASATVEVEAERDRIRAALERSEGDLFETRQELASVMQSADRTYAELSMVSGLVETLSDKLAEVETAQRGRIQALDEALNGLDKDLQALGQNRPHDDTAALAAYNSLAEEKRATEVQLDQLRRNAARDMARSSVAAGEVQRLLEKAGALLYADDEGSTAAEARKNISDAILLLSKVYIGAGAADPGKSQSAPQAFFARRLMPGGNELSDVVKKAFGDPVDEGDDGQDFTYAEPVPEEDEASAGPEQL